MRICLIVNPNAGSADAGTALRDAADRDPEVTVRETKAAGDGTRLAKEAAQEGFDIVVAAGGDGTVNEVVNGLAALPLKARLGIVPLGTGNDLPRTLAVPDDPLEAFALLRTGRERTIDLMRVRTGGRELYGANVGAGGFTGQMNEAMTDEIKDRWGPLAYLRGAVTVLPDLTRYRTRVRYDGAAWEDVHAMNIVVANARTAGGGTVVAPLANPEDGLLDVVVVSGRAGAVELAGVAARLLAGNYLESDAVTHRRARRVEIQSEPGMAFNVDGELLSDEPITFTVVPQALRVIVGDGYQPEGQPAAAR
jgi:diacylglycerol kinase (ATP)